MLVKLAESLGFDHTTVSQRLKILWMIHKQGLGFRTSWSRETSEAVLPHVNSCFHGQASVLHLVGSASCSNWSKLLWDIAIDYNLCVWADHWRENGRYTWNTEIRQSNYCTMTMFGQMLHNRYLGTLNWEVLPNSPFSSDIAPSDYTGQH